jgi:hypothetical protein
MTTRSTKQIIANAAAAAAADPTIKLIDMEAMQYVTMKQSQP